MNQGNDDLKVKVDGMGQSRVEGVTELELDSFFEFLMFLERGEAYKIMKTTQFNLSSSRSHTILEISVKIRGKKEALLSLCDLAGSERFSDEKIKDRSLLIESKNINQSLSTLTR